MKSGSNTAKNFVYFYQAGLVDLESLVCTKHCQSEVRLKHFLFLISRKICIHKKWAPGMKPIKLIEPK
jgi:hypothetical protein